MMVCKQCTIVDLYVSDLLSLLLVMVELVVWVEASAASTEDLTIMKADLVGATTVDLTECTKTSISWLFTCRAM